MDQVNSFVSLADSVVILNKNCVEILTKINDVVASQQQTVKIDYTDLNNVTQSFSLPTVGNLMNQINILNQNVRSLSSIQGSAFITDGQIVKKIITSDLNIEPVPIQNVSQAKTFSTINNSFFESLMNPMLAISIDLTNQITQNVNKILSRRYMVEFQRNDDGTLTTAGLASFNDFTTNWLNRSDIAINDFDAWLNSPTNAGVVIDTVSSYDEQMFELKVKTLNYYGLFSVIKTEIDDINNKIWYHLNDLRYYGQNNSVKTLATGDYLMINALTSSTIYKVAEVSVDYSNNKVRLELVEGYDPVVIGTNVLKYYSGISAQQSVQVTVAFNQYCVVFLKPINTDNNVIGSLWSKGISFFTNDLVLDIDNSQNLANYYVNTVYDYGQVLKDMVLKKIPTQFGVKPTAPYLQSNNFKVVQTNTYLTDSVDQNKIKQLNSQKTTIKTKISQINNSIQDRIKTLNTGNLSMAEKAAINTELNKLQSELDLQTKNLSTVVSQLSTMTQTNNNVPPTYSVRGFWNIPDPILTTNTPPQHVVQFRIQYRYSAKNGGSNPTVGYSFTPAAAADKATASPTTTTTTPGGTGGA